MKHLDFTLSLVDKITRPLKQVQASMRGFADSSQAAFGKIAVGGAALFGVVQGIRGTLSPAAEFAQALKEVGARGVGGDALKKMSAQALTFSMQYGRSAVEVVRSSSDIRAAIGTLSEAQLPRFTVATNTLAAAMQTSAGEATAYMAQLYHQFENYADRIGKVQFAEEVAGKTAYMAQAFGVNMQQMASMMAGASGIEANYGVGIDEQFTVLGQLQPKMGAEAGGSYEHYLQNALAGAKALGLNFLDASGQMLTMPAMLEQLQARYGKTIDGNLKAQAELDSAFGEGAAVIKQLYGNVDLLKRHIHALGSDDALKRAQEMAANMVDPWERLMTIWTGIRTVLGLTLLPVLYPITDSVSAMGQKFARWMQLFPNIARVIGYAMLALLSFAAAGAVVNIVVGVGAFILKGLKIIWTVLRSVTVLYTASLWLCNVAMIAVNATLRIMRGILLAVRIAAMSTAISFAFMSWPVLLIIVAIAALAAGIYFLITRWDEIKAAITNTTVFKWLASVVSEIADGFKKAWNGIVEGWHWLVATLSGGSLLKGLSAVAAGIGKVFSDVWEWLKNSFAQTFNWIIDKLNVLPGVNIKAKNITSSTPQPIDSANGLLTGGKIKNVGKGGIHQAINNNAKSVTDNSKHIGVVNLNIKENMTPGALMEWQELNS